MLAAVVVASLSLASAAGPPSVTSSLGKFVGPLPALTPAAAATGNWTNISGWLPSGPAARYYAASTYDAGADQVVLFGGRTVSSSLRDTWTFSNDSWAQQTPPVLNATNSPSARWGAVMAYDPSVHAVVLFGGTISTSTFNDTWFWTGKQWEASPTSPAPPARAYAGLAYLPSLGELILFGGQDGKLFYNDTWAYTAAGWVNVTASVGPAPPPRSLAGFIYDPEENGAVLFGGANSTLTHGDTWLFNGTGWHDLLLSVAPSPRTGFGMVFDAETETLLVYGGAGPTGTRLADFWEFANGLWSLEVVEGAGTPAPRAGTTFVDLTGLSGSGSEVVLFGGAITALALANDTWLFGQSLPFGVTSPWSNRLAYDQGDTIPISTHVLGGTPPFTFVWNGLPAGCDTVNATNVTCTPSFQGPASSVFTVGITVSDLNGTIVQPAPTTFVVNPPLGFKSFEITPYQVSVGSAVTVSVQIGGGTAPLTVGYVGLPPGCATFGGFNFKCFPSTPGTYVVTAIVIDALGTEVNESRPMVVTNSSATPSGVPLDPILVIAGAAAATAIAIVVVRYVRRSRGGGPPGGGTPGPGAGG